jgi:uncharacterized cupin superfamily protein
MAGWTKTNLRGLKDVAEEAGLAPDLSARFGREDLGAERIGISLQRLAPDARQPFGHRHKQDEEVYVVVSGAGRVKLEDEIVELGQWDAIRVAPETMRCFEAGPEGLEYLGFGTHTDDDTAPVPGWWAD